MQINSAQTVARVDFRIYRVHWHHARWSCGLLKTTKLITVEVYVCSLSLFHSLIHAYMYINSVRNLISIYQ